MRQKVNYIPVEPAELWKTRNQGKGVLVSTETTCDSPAFAKMMGPSLAHLDTRDTRSLEYLFELCQEPTPANSQALPLAAVQEPQIQLLLSIGVVPSLVVPQPTCAISKLHHTTNSHTTNKQQQTCIFFSFRGIADKLRTNTSGFCASAIF